MLASECQVFFFFIPWNVGEYLGSGEKVFLLVCFCLFRFTYQGCGQIVAKSFPPNICQFLCPPSAHRIGTERRIISEYLDHPLSLFSARTHCFVNVKAKGRGTAGGHCTSLRTPGSASIFFFQVTHFLLWPKLNIKVLKASMYTFLHSFPSVQSNLFFLLSQEAHVWSNLFPHANAFLSVSKKLRHTLPRVTKRWS